MASSNRHWPSLFKSKTCNTHHHQWQHDINSSSHLSSPCQKSPYTSATSCEERTPEPKPRWNPKPEQIRILEAIFNSGMVNPPRDEIRKIRVQLQQYGQVGDANVFYWFQNRKSRSKHKQRHLLSTRQQTRSSSAATSVSASAASSSSSSSERSMSSGSDKALSSKTVAGTTPVVDVSNSPTASVNQTFFHPAAAQGEFSGEPFFFSAPQGYCLSTAELSTLVGSPDHGLGLCSGLWSELMSHEGSKSVEEEAKTKMQLHHIYGTTTGGASALTTAVASAAATTTTTVITTTSACPVGDIQGAPGGGASSRAMVFINEVAFEVGAGLINLKEAFGEEAVLLQSSGQPVLVDEWGVTLLPLQHGASYYLV